jgi:hypothetical protein
MSVPRRLRLGMVGGGDGAFIGSVHRIAGRLDDCYELVAANLSSKPDRAAASAAGLRLDPARSYADYQEMARAEAARPDGIDAVAIVTPNYLHAPMATAFLEAGIHVICDKPLAISLAEGEALAALARKQNKVFALTHVYAGYPMVRHARAMVAAGEIGEVRLVQVEYPQDWLAEAANQSEDFQRNNWHNDPLRAGPDRLPRRYRQPRLSPGRLCQRHVAERNPGRAACVHAWPPAGRSRAGDAALRQRRARHAVEQPDGDRLRKRLAPAGVRQQGQPQLRAGKSRTSCG